MYICIFNKKILKKNCKSNIKINTFKKDKQESAIPQKEQNCGLKSK